jgi:predicted nucleic acid-binding protein
VAQRLVVADASPLIGLAAAESFDLLRGLFGSVAITIAVHDEVTAGQRLPGADELQLALAEGWLSVVPAPADGTRFPELGAGEASTLAVAIEHDGPRLVLMDDQLGRARARALGLDVSGAAGVLLASRRAGLMKWVRPGLERLMDSGFRISAEIAQAVLAEAGES